MAMAATVAWLAVPVQLREPKQGISLAD